MWTLALLVVVPGAASSVEALVGADIYGSLRHKHVRLPKTKLYRYARGRAVPRTLPDARRGRNGSEHSERAKSLVGHRRKKGKQAKTLTWPG